ITIQLDGTVVRTSGDQTIAGNKTFTGTTTLGTTNVGNTTVANGSTLAVGNSSNSITTETIASVNTGASTFSTGSGTGFFYGGATDSYKGATTISSTGNFTGTLVALTADRTTAGTVLGISAENLTTGKAIDVMLGTLYNGGSDADGPIGAVNIRAKSFTNNVLNVTASGAAGASSNLVNFTSPQLAGQVLNVDAQSLTTGKAVKVTLGNAGTGFYLNTAAGFSGAGNSLIQLQLNGVDKLRVDAAGNTTLGGTLAVTGATTFNGAVTVAANNNFTQAGTGNFSTGSGTVSLNGNTTVNGTLTATGTATLGSGSANELVVAGAAAGSPPTITANGSDANISVRIVPKGTGGIILGSSTSTPITAHYSATASLDIASMQNACVNTTITVTGAVAGDTVVATPTAVAGGIETLDDVVYYAYVSAANTVTIRSCETTNTARNPGAQTWRVDVWRH
ncbi:MAG: hypothetical protein M3T56_12285, partial [Chloroflexota bacterium]|nr:hypothetical protein [Chloroflexota bacterium]